jgi:ribonuclease HI
LLESVTLICFRGCSFPVLHKLFHNRDWALQAIGIKNLTARVVLTHLDDNGQRWMSDLVAYVDGGSLGNPGPSGIGVVIEGSDGGTIRIARWIGRQDNNVAEYVALLEALQCAQTLKARALHVYSDSQVVVRQMQGKYACHSPRLYSLHWICRKLARSFKFSITHVPRERNAEANHLANSAVREQISLKTSSSPRTT